MRLNLKAMEISRKRQLPHLDQPFPRMPSPSIRTDPKLSYSTYFFYMVMMFSSTRNGGCKVTHTQRRDNNLVQGLPKVRKDKETQDNPGISE